MKLGVRGLSKSYGRKRALRDVSLDVEEGEFCVLLGPSGCGKTTLLRCIAGLEVPDAGRVLFDGRDVVGNPARERDVSMVFQGFALFPLMTAFENIAFPLHVRNVPKPKIKERVEEVAILLRIERYLQDKPSDLSGGEQQRVALARAIVREPKLFLLDEPLSSLDAPLRAEMRFELKRLHERISVTTVYVTHDQAEALSLADKVGVLSEGSIVQFDSPGTIYSKPSSLFVARFVGNVPSNVLDVKMEIRGGRILLRANGFEIEAPPDLESVLRSSAANEFALSIRPEDLGVVPGPAEGTLDGNVKLVENLGAALLLELDVGGSTLKAVADSSREYKKGDRVGIRPASGKMRLFDRDSGAALG